MVTEVTLYKNLLPPAPAQQVDNSVAPGNFNSTGNKANGSSIACADGSAFPMGCTNP